MTRKTSPNLLFIFTDEQRWDTLRACGNMKIRTPNLDRLAEQSIVFDRPYVTQSVCTPSRSSIMTGLYPHTNGCTRNNLPLPEACPALVELADFSDYYTGYIGKWHLGDEIFCQHGFDEWISTEDEYWKHYSTARDRNERSSYHRWLMEKGYEPDVCSDGRRLFRRATAARMPERHCKPSFQAERARSFIEQNRSAPFVLYVNFLEPHMPFFGPRDDQYDPADVDLPPNFEMPPANNVPYKIRRRFRKTRKLETFTGTPTPGESEWRRLIAHYWGLVSQVDTATGRILDALDEFGVTDNTIIVFTSDHGDMMGSHQLITKDIQYEEAVRVPLLLKIPDHPRCGTRFTAPVSQIDLIPTLLDYLGKKPTAELEGYSWRPTLDENKPLTEPNVFIEWSPQGDGVEKDRDHSIRTIITPDGWKFNWELYGEHELYHLGEDPWESTNLYGRPEYKDLVRELSAHIQTWQQRTNDTVRFPEP